jgi:hypothetical protein
MVQQESLIVLMKRLQFPVLVMVRQEMSRVSPMSASGF